VWFKEDFLDAEYKVRNCGRTHKGSARLLRLADHLVTTLGLGGEPGSIEFESDPKRFQGIRHVAVISSSQEVRANVLMRLKKESKLAFPAEVHTADVILITSEVERVIWGENEYYTDSLGVERSEPKSHRSVQAMGFAAAVDGRKFVIFWTFWDEDTTQWERRPSTNFARNFLKQYAKQNQPAKAAPRP